MEDAIINLLGIFSTISAIIFAYLAFRRNDSNDLKDKALKEGELLSDIAYIKSSIDRMESKLDRLENNYHLLQMKIIKLEEVYNSLEKRIDDMEESK